MSSGGFSLPQWWVFELKLVGKLCFLQCSLNKIHVNFCFNDAVFFFKCYSIAVIGWVLQRKALRLRFASWRFTGECFWEQQLGGVRKVGLRKKLGPEVQVITPTPITQSSTSSSGNNGLDPEVGPGGGASCCLLQLPTRTFTSYASPRLLFYFIYQLACEVDRPVGIILPLFLTDTQGNLGPEVKDLPRVT